MAENRCPECAQPGRRTKLHADDLILEGEPDTAAPWVVCTGEGCGMLWQVPIEELKPAKHRHPWYCCGPDNPCEVHLSTSDRLVTLTSKEVRDAVRARAEREGISSQDLVTKAINTYLGRAKRADVWAAVMPLNVPAAVAAKLKG